MARFESCVWAPVTTPGPTPRVSGYRGLVLHRRGGNSSGGGKWYCNPLDALFSTFFIPLEGSPRQQIDDSLRAPVLANGAALYASAEIEGSETLTQSQMNGLALIYAEGHRVHGWPLALADNPGDNGLMRHGAGGLPFGANLQCPGDAEDTIRSAVLAAATSLIGSPNVDARAVTETSSLAAEVGSPAGVPPSNGSGAEAALDGEVGGQKSLIQPPIVIGPIRPILNLPIPSWFTQSNPGSVAGPITVSAAQLQTSIIGALGSRYAPPGGTAPPEVVWYDHDGEVLFIIGETLVNLMDGLVLVALTLQTDQTGPGQVTVPLGVGTASQPVGMTVATELRPRSPTPLLVDRWGDAATAAAWGALLDVAKTMAEQAGADSNGAPYVPGAMSAASTGFTVTPQARQAMDSVGSK